MDFREVNLQPSPELQANSFSRLFLLWVLPFLRRGAKQNLNLEDLYQPLQEDASERLGRAVEEKWNDEVIRAGAENRRPRLWKVIARLIYLKYSLMGLGYTFDELVLRTIQPLALRNFIQTFIVEEPKDTHRWDQYFYAGVLVLVTFCHAIFFQKLYGATLHLGMKCRLGVSSLIYRKMLRLCKSDSEHANVGKLCNLLSGDVSRLDQSFTMLHYLYIAPIQLSIYTYLLWNELGVACLGGVGCVLFILPLQTLNGRFFMYFRARIARRTDERGRLLNEILAGIRLIKMYTWEKPFANLISQLRRAEITFIRRSLYLRGMYVTVYNIAAKLIPFCGLIFYVAGGNTLTADKAFFTITVFNTILQVVMHRVPTATSLLGELLASLNRIEEFILSKENCGVEPSKSYHFKDNIAENGSIVTNGKDAAESGKRVKQDEIYVVPKVEMENYSASWTQEQQTLKNLTLNLRGSQLVMVVGHVGSGKSSFLNAVLNELPYTSMEKEEGSHCHVQGRLSYASQEPWIFPSTVRQNILFGLEMEAERYWKVIKLCCLIDDLKQFPDGDMTMVGERGMALSGGQKARLNLARAIYQQADVYLLDDPLSAVDTKVSQALFQKCIRTHLEGKLRILVTHQLQYLPMADHVIVLNREGRIWGQGTYEQLKNSGIDFTSLIRDEYTNDTNKELQDVDMQLSRQRRNSNSSHGATGNENVTEEITDHKNDEKKEVGSIGCAMYARYFKAGGSFIIIGLIVLNFLVTQFLYSFTDFWVSLWTNNIAVTNVTKKCNQNFTRKANSSWALEAETRGVQEGMENEQEFFAYVYCGIMAGFIFVAIFRSLLFFWYCMRISTNLHDGMFQSLVRAPIKFFDDNPSGRIMNRFTKDLNHIDELLPVAFYDYMATLFTLFGMLALNISANYYIAFPSVLLLVTFWKLRTFFLSTARDLKRIESLAKSPMFTHVTMTIQGLTTVRALKAQHRVMKQFEKIQDSHTAVHYMIFITNLWFSVWLELISVFFLAIVTFGFLFITTSGHGGNVGMAISAILNISSSLQWGIRQSAETENYMTSVERVLEYSNLKSEAPLETPEEEQVSQSWPNDGRLKFDNISLAYDDANENKVLKEISFSTEPQEKVGIVGRTGAGKSSLINALFRLTEPCHGSISIDGISLDKLGLHILRSRISVIPQDPVLFTGTLRYNLDPFEEFPDDRLWSVLKEVDLHHVVQNLDCRVADEGSNFSLGQRQLVCLARALLRKNRVVVLDEATANVDPATDQLVQRTIRSKFADCTVLTIAHRLHSVFDNDRILVLDAGKVVEFDRPEALMKNTHSCFNDMLHYQQNQGRKTGES